MYSFNGDPFSFMDRASLIRLRLSAIRAGVWFRRLPRIDRVLVELTIRVARAKILGASLIHRLFAVVSKLKGLLENKLSLMIKQYGVPLANKICCLAQKWGNVTAKAWVDDLEFARYLAALKLNSN